MILKDYAFDKCSSLTSLIFESPSSLIEIGNSSFFRCKSLKEVSIPPSVTKIGDEAFTLCTSLKKLSIASPSIVVGNDAFCGCLSITDLSIPPFLNQSEIGIGKDFN